MSVYIGIDQSYTGFGITAYDSATASGHTEVKAFPAKKYGSGVDRLEAIGQWLYDWLVAVDIGVIAGIAMEGYANGAKFGREAAGELGGRVKEELRDLQSFRYHSDAEIFYPTIVPPTSVKKFATGKGTAQKNEILLAVFKKWEVEFSDDNAADSYVLARIAAALNTDPDTLLAYEREVLAKLTPHTEMFPPSA